MVELDERDEEIRALPPAERHRYFVDRVLETAEVWVLVDPEDDQVGVVHDDDEDVDYMLVWPEERFAAAEASEHFARHRPASFTIDAWLDNVVPRLDEDGVLVGVFPIWDRGVWAQTAAEHANELERGVAEA